MSSETITRNDLTNILNEIVAIDGTDMAAQEIEDFVDSLNTQKLLKSVETKMLLWTNDSPTSDFASQTVLNNGELDGYDGVEIMYKAYKSYGSSLVVKIEMDSSNSQMQGFINAGGVSVPMIFERPVSVSSSGVQFSACNSKSTNSSSTAVNAGGCIPYKIYGCKLEQL